MLRRDGYVKVLDFGLAKLTEHQPSIVDTQEPTVGLVRTKSGTVLGTVAYMSPEQARGLEVDARTDIWSLGVVMYEMIAKRRPFAGDSAIEVMNAILKEEPPELGETKAKVTPALERIVRRCLEKKPERRFQTATDLGFALEALSIPSGARLETAALHAATQGASKSRLFGNARLAWIAAAGASLALLASLPFVITHLRHAPPTEAAAMRFMITPPEKATNVGLPVISPDGRNLIFSATVEGKRQIWMHPVNGFTEQPISGTEGLSASPFWSPDSRSIAFSADGKLKRIDVAGGMAQTLCNLPGVPARSGSWGRDGTIIFYGVGAIYRVSATGGEPTRAIAHSGGRATNVQIRPHFLPDGRHFLHYGGVTQEAGIYLASLDGKESRRLLAADSDGIYAVSTAQGAGKGWLIFLREGALLAQPFDANQLTLTGEPFAIADQVQPGSFSVSDTGILTYQSLISYENVQLGWIDRAGKPLELVGATGFALGPRLSPDGKRVAVIRLEAKTGAADINVIDLARNTESRLTFDPGNDLSPVWSPDGSRIVWPSDRAQTFHLYQKLASGVGQEEPLLQSGVTVNPSSWSADGKFLLYSQYVPETLSDIWVLPLNGDRKPFLFLQTQFNESGAQFSPDGRWVAYISNESGKYEIYAQTFPAGSGKWPVSTGGGQFPQWRGDGKELFYLSPDRKLMAVEVKLGATFEAGLPKALFDLAAAKVQSNTYTVTADGQRFLFPRLLRESATAPFAVVVNWTAEAKR